MLLTRFPEICNIVADVADHGVALPATWFYYGRFVDAMGVQEHREGASDGVYFDIIPVDSKFIFSQCREDFAEGVSDFGRRYLSVMASDSEEVDW